MVTGYKHRTQVTMFHETKLTFVGKKTQISRGLRGDSLLYTVASVTTRRQLNTSASTTGGRNGQAHHPPSPFPPSFPSFHHRWVQQVFIVGGEGALFSYYTHVEGEGEGEDAAKKSDTERAKNHRQK